MSRPDGFSVTIAQANVPQQLVPAGWRGGVYRIKGIVTAQASAGNDPLAGVHLTPFSDTGFEGIVLGPLDRESLQHDDGIDLDGMYVWGSHVGDVVNVMHGGRA